MSKLTILLMCLALPVFAAFDVCPSGGMVEFKQRLDRDNPSLKETLAQKAVLSELEGQAAQRPNPSMEFEHEVSEQFGVDVRSFRLMLLHTVELGSKRDRRIELARAQKDVLAQDIDSSYRENYIDALIMYRRAQQLSLFISIIEDAIGSFDSLIATMKQRKRLTPLETVSLDTLELAKGDLQGRLHEYVHEKETVEVEVMYLANCKNPKFEYAAMQYPRFSKIVFDKGHGLAKRENAVLTQMDASKKQAESLKIPDLRIGPIVGRQNQGHEEIDSVGVGIFLDIPLFHANDAQRSLAEKKLREQQVRSSNRLRRLELKLEKEKHVYHHSLESLSAMPSLKEVGQKHQRVKRLYARGVVSPSVVIEAHRQHLEYIRSYFEIENDILNSLKKMYLITADENLVKKVFK